MAGRIGLGVDLPSGQGAGPDRFAAPRSLHAGALWIAFAAPFAATAALLLLRFAG